MQLVAEEDEHNFAFDLLDCTKLIPEELVPIKWVGTMTLDRNPTNYFAGQSFPRYSRLESVAEISHSQRLSKSPSVVPTLSPVSTSRTILCFVRRRRLFRLAAELIRDF